MNRIAEDLFQKRKTLVSILKKYDRLMIAFSGGVDSTLLLAMADEIFKDNSRLVAITATSPIHKKSEKIVAEAFAEERGIKHLIVESEEMDSMDFYNNPGNRCYVCKKIIFSKILDVAEKMGIDNVAHAANLDDYSDYRPGLKAAVEMGILSPLVDAKMTKRDIRKLAREMHLTSWNKPSSGCLATRIPYGEKITVDNLNMVSSAETILSNLGVEECRVRFHGELAKIEVNGRDIEKLMDKNVRSHIVSEFKKLGFLYVAIDMEEYRSGRLNRSL